MRSGTVPGGRMFCLSPVFAVCLCLALSSCPAHALEEGGSAFQRRERLISLFEAEGAGAVPALMDALDDESSFVRGTAVHLLVRAGEPAMKGIAKAIAHPDFHVRRVAVRGLMRMGAVSPYWEQIAGDEHQSIQREILRGAISTAGASRRFLVFDGESNYAEAEDRVLVGEDDFSYEIRFKPAEQPEVTSVLMGVGRGDNPGRPGINLRYTGRNTIHFTAANRRHGVSLSYRTEEEGEWLHVAAVVNRRGKAQLFVDGDLADEKDAAEFGKDDGFDVADRDYERGAFRVGRRPHSNIWYFKGSICEVRVWRRALTQAEILENMNSRLTGEENGLILYWPVDEGSGNTLRDLSASGNKGRVINPVWSNKDSSPRGNASAAASF